MPFEKVGSGLYRTPRSRTRGTGGPAWTGIFAGIIAFAVLLSAFFYLRTSSGEGGSSVKRHAKLPEIPFIAQPPASDFAGSTGIPTDADILADPPVQGAFMPTASGKTESALYGSVRTASDGRARFHEGIDIAPQHYGRKRRPADVVRCIAPGRIAYINKVGGDSNYGIHVFVEHDDPVGKVYSLYAHLASVTNAIRREMEVEAGTPLGIVGNSGNLGIPAVRSHLHLEIGLMLTDNFGRWCDKNGAKPNRGNYHGWNLYSVNPVEFIREAKAPGDGFSFLKFAESLKPAVSVVATVKSLPAYFKNYPKLWRGSEYKPGDAVFCELSECGLILSGRAASSEELAALSKKQKFAVVSVDADVLGRNGARLVKKGKGGTWMPASALERWYDIFSFRQ